MINSLDTTLNNFGRISFGYKVLAPKPDRTSNSAVNAVTSNTYESRKYGTSFTDVRVSYRTFFTLSMWGKVMNNGREQSENRQLLYGTSNFYSVRSWFLDTLLQNWVPSVYQLDESTNQPVAIQPGMDNAVASSPAGLFLQEQSFNIMPSIINFNNGNSVAGFKVSFGVDNTHVSDLTYNDLYNLVNAITNANPSMVELFSGIAMMNAQQYNGASIRGRVDNQQQGGFQQTPFNGNQQQNNFGGNNNGGGFGGNQQQQQQPSPFGNNNNNNPQNGFQPTQQPASFGNSNGGNQTMNTPAPFGNSGAANGNQQQNNFGGNNNGGGFGGNQQQQQPSPFGNNSGSNGNQQPVAQTTAPSPFANNAGSTKKPSPFASNDTTNEEVVETIATATDLGSAANSVFGGSETKKQTETNTVNEVKEEASAPKKGSLASTMSNTSITDDDIF